MKVRFALCLIVLSAVSACANVQDVRGRDPVFFGSTPRNGVELIQRDSLGVQTVLVTTTWQGKTEARLSTRIARRGQRLIEPAQPVLATVMRQDAA